MDWGKKAGSSADTSDTGSIFPFVTTAGSESDIVGGCDGCLVVNWWLQL